ncbi:MAG: TIR domain-containing protein [Chloroflexi bacterium]|nr:TIR domain-containing protein [Chloroflexota bacterium]
MADKPQVFISYRKSGGQTPQIAVDLARSLKEAYGYEVFLDVMTMRTADAWRQRIYDNIRKSDVLILLLRKDTAESDWVQREVDFARGAGVSILPLRVDDIDSSELLEAADQLAISDLQHSPFFSGLPSDYDRLLDDIRRLTKETRRNQRAFLDQLARRWRPTPPTISQARYRTFRIPGGSSSCLVHLALGDMLDMEYFDVIVNSENDHMQMARYFEYTALSSRLRTMGALVEGGMTLEDTLQDHLNEQMRRGAIKRPVGLTQVLVTRAGHPHSELRQIASLVFHASTVRLAAGEMDESIKPISPDGIKKTVRNCLQAMIALNQNGAGNLPSTPEDRDIHPIGSIIFPMIGAGSGERAIEDVVHPIVEGVNSFMQRYCENPGLASLTRIYLCAYTQSDAEVLEKAMRSHLEPVV